MKHVFLWTFTFWSGQHMTAFHGDFYCILPFKQLSSTVTYFF